MSRSVRDIPGIIINGRSYKLPETPQIIICIDGSEPGYIERAVEAGRAPTFARFMANGTNRLSNCVIPSFTNPNNLSIITGRPPLVHGIAGNYFFDPERGEEVMMNDPKFLRAPTILKGLHDAGAKVAVVTAKDKLRLLLSHGLDYRSGRAIAFSSEKADQANERDNGLSDALNFVGMPLPEVYSQGLSEFVFASGVRLLETFRPDVMYLSTTDYVQHSAAPGSAIANDFYAMIDGYINTLDRLGAVLIITADHGMNDKHRPDGSPDVIYLQPLFDTWTGKGQTRIILPITDPYVAHHGALGSFATVYVPTRSDVVGLMQRLREVEEVEAVLSRAEACQAFELPEDRIGDIVVLSKHQKVLGTSPENHDLSGLKAPLRSHGGLSEQRVPMISNRQIGLPEYYELRNFDAFSIALNHIVMQGALA